MGFEIAQAAAICAISWVLWKYFRQFFVKSPLDNIPGPPSGSWLYGKSQIFAYEKLFSLGFS